MKATSLVLKENQPADAAAEQARCKAETQLPAVSVNRVEMTTHDAYG